MTSPLPSSVPPSLASRLKSRRFLEAAESLDPVLLWAALAGLVVGLVGGTFRWLVTYTLNGRVHWLDSLRSTPGLGVAASVLLSGGMVYLGFWLMRRYAPDTSGSGIPQIEGMLSGFFPLLWLRVLPVKFVSGVLMLGGGMVMGREGPTIQMGGAIGKMVSTWFRASNEQTRILADILFVFEEMRPTFSNNLGAYQAVTMACITATVGLQLLLGPGPTLTLAVCARHGRR